MGGAGAHLALPGCRRGEPGGGLPLAAAGSLPLPGGSGREVQHFCKQRPLSETPAATSGTGLQRSSVPHCRAGRKQAASAGSLSPRAPLQALWRVCPPSVPPPCHTPGQLRNTAGSSLESLGEAVWHQYMHMDVDLVGVEWLIGAGSELELPPAKPQQKLCSWSPVSPSQDWGVPTTVRCEKC